MKLLKWIKLTFLILVGLVVLLLVIGFSYEKIMSYTAKSKFPPKGKLIDVDGHKLHMVTKGAGSPIVVFE